MQFLLCISPILALVDLHEIYTRMNFTINNDQYIFFTSFVFKNASHLLLFRSHMALNRNPLYPRSCASQGIWLIDYNSICLKLVPYHPGCSWLEKLYGYFFIDFLHLCFGRNFPFKQGCQKLIVNNLSQKTISQLRKVLSKHKSYSLKLPRKHIQFEQK